MHQHPFVYAAKRYPRQFTATLFYALSVSAGSILVPYVLGQITRRIPAKPPALSVALWIGGLLLLLAGVHALKIRWFLAMDRFGGRFVEDMLADLHRALSHADLRDIDAMGSERITHILYNDLLSSFTVVGNFGPSMLGSLLILGFGIAMAFAVDPVIAAFLAAGLLGGALISRIAKRGLERTSSETNDRMKELHAAIAQAVAATESHRVNRFDAKIESLYRGYVRQFIDAALREDGRRVFFSGLSSHYTQVLQILLSVLLASQYVREDIGTTVFALVLFSVLMQEGDRLHMLTQRAFSSIVSFRHLGEVLALARPDGTRACPPIEEISLSDITFTHAGEHPLTLQTEGTIRWRRGDAVRILGANGSGKSTLLKLLLRLYRPDAGRIAISGADLHEISADSYYARVAWIGQDEKFPPCTPRAYFSLRFGEEASERAIPYLETLGFGPVDRPIEAGGAHLSGGERKKLLMTKLHMAAATADVLILDEIDAGLDRESLRLLRAELEALLARRTHIVLWIAHGEGLDLPATHTVEMEQGRLRLRA